MEILLLDNDSSSHKKLKLFLETQGHVIYSCETKQEVSQLLGTNRSLDFILIDPLSSEGNDYHFIKEIVSLTATPLIIISSFSEEDEVVKGLQTGAVDYMVKPLRYFELQARLTIIHKHIGQHTPLLPPTLSFRQGELEINKESKQVFVNREEVKLTLSEFLLLKTLATHPNRAFSRSELLDRIKGIDFNGSDRVIDSHIKDLRKKIEPNPQQPIYIITVHGSGYRFGQSD